MNSSLCPLYVITPFRFLILFYCTHYLSKRLRSNHVFCFSTRDVTKTAWVHFVGSILMHGLSPSVRAETCVLGERSENIYNFVGAELTVRLGFGSIFLCFAFQIVFGWLRSWRCVRGSVRRLSMFRVAKGQWGEGGNGPIPFRIVDRPPFFFAVCAFRSCGLCVCCAAYAFLQTSVDLSTERGRLFFGAFGWIM